MLIQNPQDQVCHLFLLDAFVFGGIGVRFALPVTDCDVISPVFRFVNILLLVNYCAFCVPPSRAQTIKRVWLRCSAFWPRVPDATGKSADISKCRYSNCRLWSVTCPSSSYLPWFNKDNKDLIKCSFRYFLHWKMWRSGQRSAPPSETSWFALWRMLTWGWSRQLQSFSSSSAKKVVSEWEMRRIWWQTATTTLLTAIH